jgi:hypothetical protein
LTALEACFDVAKALIVVAAMVGGAFACGQLLGASFDDLEHRSMAVEAGVPDAGRESCAHAGPPSPPDGGAPGGSVEFVVAQTVTSFGDAPGPDGRAGYATVGFDIDHTCTGLTERPSCKEPVWATDYVDGDRGRDNATGKLWAWLLRAGKEPEGGLQASTPWIVLARVSAFNGQANDEQVTVEFFWGTRLASSADGVPRRDGTDQWDISAYLLGVDAQGQHSLDRSLLVDHAAYVSGGMIVARLPTFPLANPGLVPRTAYDVTWAGRLAQDDAGSWEIHDGVQSARVPLHEIFAGLSGYRSSLDPTMSLCTNDPDYSIFKAAICSFADITATAGDASTPCDALSNGSTFEGFPARLGGIDTTALGTTNCAPDVDPANDSCDNLP